MPLARSPRFALLLAPFLLAGCLPEALPPILDPAPAPAAPAVDSAAQAAIAACLSRAETQGLNVTGVDRADPVMAVGAPGAGLASGHNVFLEVGGTGPSFTVRCSHTTATGEARIMTL